MPPPLLHYVDSAAAAILPQNCEPSSSFLAVVSSYLHTCIPTPLALVSSVLGTCSIVSWLFAQLPQIYKNYQIKSTSGLSIYFLIEWCLGDASNLVGALLTRQAGWQVVVAGYYVLVDLTLVFQFFWYTYHQNQQVIYESVAYPRHDGGAGGVLDGLSVSGEDNLVYRSVAREASTKRSDTKGANYTVEGVSSSSSSNGHRHSSYSNEKRLPVVKAGNGSPPGFASPRTLLIASMLCAVVANASPTEGIPESPVTHKDSLEIIGQVISWMSTFLYLGSRPPQLYKNYCRKSTAGLSPLLFMAAFGGNLFYSASLLTNPYAWNNFPPYGGGGWADADGSNRLDWISRSTPFFLGAFGVLFFDGFMGVQFLMYGSKDDESLVEVDGEEDEDPKDGRDARWTRVRGWMRGWIPSISPVRRQQQHAQESRALLGEGSERYGAV